MALPAQPTFNGATATDLIGWTVSLVSPLPKRWDHTYVTSACGLSWGCYGRSAGGREICRDLGDRVIASCLAGPTGTAGIRYGVTGVCHQMSNRILHSANKIKVSAARGYNVSRSFFGHYGSGPWPELNSCYLTPQTQHQTYSQPRAAGDEGFSKIKDFGSSDAGVPEGSSMPITHYDSRVADLAELLREQAGPNFSTDIINQVVRNHVRFWMYQDQLVASLDSGNLGAQEYMDRFNEAAKATMMANKQALGPELFYIVFGEEGDNVSDMIDPRVFLDDEPEYKNYG